MILNLLPALLVNVTRNNAIESRHMCHVALAHAYDDVLVAWGDADRAMFPRSAIKMLQALAFVKQGAADRFGCTDDELALSCASHGGENIHQEKIARWLERIGLSVNDLGCGAHPPYSRSSYEHILRSGNELTALANNCSGKHTAMLCLALHKGFEIRKYQTYGHQVQQTIMDEMSAFMDFRLADTSWGIDGCGVPSWQIPLKVIAMSLSRFGTPDAQDSAYSHPTQRIWKAMTDYPELVSGAGTFDTVVMQRGRGEVLCKTGAEGFCVCVHRPSGMAVAVKCDDGSRRGAHAAVLYVIETLAWLGDDPAHYDDLRPLVKTIAKTPVGEVIPEASPEQRNQLHAVVDQCQA